MADQQPQAAQPIPRRVPDNNGYPTTKLMLIACLGGMALVLGCLIVVTQIQINNAHQRLRDQSQTPMGLKSNDADGNAKKGDSRLPKTYLKSDPTKISDLYLNHQRHNVPNSGNARATAAEVYWGHYAVDD